MPGLRRRRSPYGRRSQNRTPAVPERGRKTIRSSTGTSCASTREASQSPAMNPITTLGRAAMISTVGFTFALILGWTNCEV